MKKLLVVMLAMAVAVSFGSMAMAKDGLSVDLGFAWNFNGADMGKTIVKDGETGAGINPVWGDVIVSDKLMVTMKKGTNGLVISDYKEGGSMQGLNTALRLRYDFLNAFFARLGFVYDWQLTGGEQELTLGASWGVLAGQKVKQTWTYGMWGIPITVGINVPINDGKLNVYAGLGLTYYSGYWQLEAKAPNGYLGGVGAVDEKVKFEASGIGFNWTVGTSAEVYQDISLFLELDATVAAGMADNDLKSAGGQAAFGGVTKIAYPVNLSTQLVRFGVNYKLPVQL